MKPSKLTRTIGIALWLMAASTKVLYGADTTVPARHIVISIPQKQLTLLEGQSIVKTYAV